MNTKTIIIILSILAVVGIGYYMVTKPDQWEKYVNQYPDLQKGFENQSERSKSEYGEWHYKNYGSKEGRALPQE